MISLHWLLAIASILLCLRQRLSRHLPLHRRLTVLLHLRVLLSIATILLLRRETLIIPLLLLRRLLHSRERLLLLRSTTPTLCCWWTTLVLTITSRLDLRWLHHRRRLDLRLRNWNWNIGQSFDSFSLLHITNHFEVVNVLFRSI